MITFEYTNGQASPRPQPAPRPLLPGQINERPRPW